MPIEFHCPSCQQQLRVPDTAAGKNAKCPKCATIVAVPTSTPAAAPPPSPSPFQSPSPFGFGQPEPRPPGGSFGAPMPNPTAPNPFASHDLGGAYGGGLGGATVNPYASPAAISERPVASGGIQPTVVDTGAILNLAIKLWQENLGLLVGATAVYALIVIVAAIVFSFVNSAFMFAGGRMGLLLGGLMIQIVMTTMQAFLNTGFMQLCFRLCRGQRADVGQLFGGGGQFLPVLGFSLLISLPSQLPVMIGQAMGAPFNQDAQIFALIGQGVMSIAIAVAMLFLWPVSSLLADGRARFQDSFGLALKITNGNKLTSFLLCMLTFGIILAGTLAFCVGLLFAMPLVFMLWAAAYLTMSGQISPHPNYRQPYQQPMYR